MRLMHIVFQQIWKKGLVPKYSRYEILLSKVMKSPNILCKKLSFDSVNMEVL